jgi:hypothetical protein
MKLKNTKYNIFVYLIYQNNHNNNNDIYGQLAVSVHFVARTKCIHIKFGCPAYIELHFFNRLIDHVSFVKNNILFE